MAKKSTLKTKRQKNQSSKNQRKASAPGFWKQNSKAIKILLFASIVAILAYFLYSGDFFNQASSDYSKTFTLISPDYSGIDFENQVIDEPMKGLQFYDYFYNGSGLAIGDINNDQLPDIFFTGNEVPNRLYINKGNFRFEDISIKAGIQSDKWGTGATLVDINEDGWLDIYVSNSGPYMDSKSTENELYINNGDNTFTEQAAKYGIADGSRSTQASFFDMDNDGDLDLWVMNHALRNRGNSATEWFEKAEALNLFEYNRECSTLYRNEGNGRFTDISKEAGIQKIGFGLGIAVNDFDENGYLDVYVANDFFIPDFMFLNNGDGTFTDKLDKKATHVPYYAMGCDAADFNNDGLTDMIVVDMTPSDHVRNKVLMASMDVKGFQYLTELKNFTPQYMVNSLFVNNGRGIMSDIGLYAGVSQTDWSWAPLLADFDNDGFKDLMVTNGFRKDTKNNDWKIELNKIRQEKGDTYTPADYFEHLKKADVNPVPNQIYKNIDGLNFKNETDNWGFSKPSFSNGAAYADLDQDGDLDLVINNFDEPAFVYRNNSRERNADHFIRFKLTNGSNDNKVLHSRINIYCGDKMQSADYAFTRGYESYVEPIVHFGLGQEQKIDRAVIYWKDGTQSIIENPRIDQVHVIDRAKASLATEEKPKADPLFTDISANYLHPNFVHQENYYDDFQKEVLLPHRQSMMGPALATGDVNGDGLEDFYVGGAKDQPGMLYFQKENAHFYNQASSVFNADKGYEDVGAAFLDIDGDKDLDLYVASGGGGEFEGNEIMLQDRLYLNDGSGNFTPAQGRLPKMKTSTQCIAPADWDQDGDLDLFIGGRTSPGKYPLPPTSYLLVNNNGVFTQQTENLAPELTQIGMVTDAEWMDVDHDNLLDLIVVGEWMPITVFKNTGNGFENQTKDFGFDKTAGWWYSLHKFDFDKDGDEDLIAGNVGLNNKFHPSEKKPLYVYANDFDKNGTLDIVLSKIYNDQKVPVRGKECSTAQMPFVSEKFPTYTSFATASLEEIYEESELLEAVNYEVYNFASLYLENTGDGQFIIKELPSEAQLNPINGIVTHDFDKDGNEDMVLAGNMLQTEVETPSYDAGKGLYLKGLGDGNFETKLQIEYSGLMLHEDAKNLKLIHLGKDKRPALLVANNNSFLSLVVYRK